METKIYTMNGTENGSITLDDQIFAHAAHPQTINDVVKAQLNNQRQGTVNTRTRGEISGTTKKMFKQKGTGRARQGSTRSAQWVGGGRIFGPVPRDYNIVVPKKTRRLALQSALSSKLLNKQVYVIDEINFAEPKTKAFMRLVENLKLNSTALFVVEEDNRNAKLSARNLPGVETAQFNTINVFDILKYDAFVMTKAAAEKIQEVYA